VNRAGKVWKAAGGGFIAAWIAVGAACARAQEPWKPAEVIEPQSLSRELSKSSPKPLVLQVGFQQLYNRGHVPGALYCGPASTPEGMERLKASVEKVPRSREIVIYCGCCPWKNCPNVRPAFRELKSLGFQHVKVLSIPRDFGTDRVQQGLPTARHH